jgi:hypothetical protein
MSKTNLTNSCVETQVTKRKVVPVVLVTIYRKKKKEHKCTETK